jgi:hypothetical protein
MNNPFDDIMQELKEIKERVNSMPQGTTRPEPEIIDTMQLCQKLKMSEPALIKLRKKKKIPFFQVGRNIRYNWPAVVTALEKSKN